MLSPVWDFPLLSNTRPIPPPLSTVPDVDVIFYFEIFALVARGWIEVAVFSRRTVGIGLF